MKRIVVGVDGSEASKAALRAGVELARVLPAEIHVVSAWQPYYGTVELPVSVDRLEAGAAEALRETVDAGDVGVVTVTESVEMGDAAHVLLQQAENADLLVVGTRGRGGFAGLLLGSVSQKCAQHAPCPVLVVPLPQT